MDMHKRMNSKSTEAIVEVELLRADMLDLVANAAGAVLSTLNEDGTVSTRAFGSDNRLFAGALLGAQRLAMEHFKAGGSNVSNEG